MAQYVEAQKRMAIEARARSGLNWFYWIAALSLVNSLIGLSGASLTFVVGLGATQVVDAVMQGFAADLAGNGSLIARGIGLVLNVAIAALFAALGFLGIKHKRWAVITGMLLYGIDSLILLSVQDWFGALFHAWALWGIWNGLKALNLLKGLEKQDSLPLQPAVVEIGRQPVNGPRVLEIAAAVAVFPLVCLFLAVVAAFAWIMVSQ